MISNPSTEPPASMPTRDAWKNERKHRRHPRKGRWETATRARTLLFCPSVQEHLAESGVEGRRAPCTSPHWRHFAAINLTRFSGNDDY